MGQGQAALQSSRENQADERTETDIAIRLARTPPLRARILLPFVKEI